MGEVYPEFSGRVDPETVEALIRADSIGLALLTF